MENWKIDLIYRDLVLDDLPIELLSGEVAMEIDTVVEVVTDEVATVVAEVDTISLFEAFLVTWESDTTEVSLLTRFIWKLNDISY